MNSINLNYLKRKWYIKATEELQVWAKNYEKDNEVRINVGFVEYGCKYWLLDDSLINWGFEGDITNSDGIVPKDHTEITFSEFINHIIENKNIEYELY